MKIEIGDRVDVFFERSESLFDMTVVYTPCQTGDAFHLLSNDSVTKGQLYYVQNYSYMKRTYCKVGEK